MISNVRSYRQKPGNAYGVYNDNTVSISGALAYTQPQH